MKVLIIGLFIIHFYTSIETNAVGIKGDFSSTLEWYAIDASVLPTTFVSGFEGYSYMPINDVYSYLNNGLKAISFEMSDVDEFYDIDDPVYCDGASYVCSIELYGADVNSDGLLSQTELSNFLSTQTWPYTIPNTLNGLFYKN